MELVEFDYVGRAGCTIYSSCFQRYINARYVLERPEVDWSKLVVKTEAVFYYLVNEGHKYGFNVDSILEIPTSNGLTCFHIASQCSENISKFLITRGIKIHSISTNMIVPEFQYSDLAIQMME